jgi:hypothetical protein
MQRSSATRHAARPSCASKALAVAVTFLSAVAVVFAFAIFILAALRVFYMGLALGETNYADVDFWWSEVLLGTRDWVLCFAKLLAEAVDERAGTVFANSAIFGDLPIRVDLASEERW